jgi:hypothetical protein
MTKFARPALIAVLACCVALGLSAQAAKPADAFKPENARLWFNPGQSDTPIAKLTVEQVKAWFGTDPRKQDNYVIFETGLPNELLAFIPGGNSLELVGLAFFTVRSGNLELAIGMDRKLVISLLGEPTGTRKGALEYLSWANIGPNFRLGFEADGSLLSIRL